MKKGFSSLANLLKGNAFEAFAPFKASNGDWVIYISCLNGGADGLMDVFLQVAANTAHLQNPEGFLIELTGKGHAPIRSKINRLGQAIFEDVSAQPYCLSLINEKKELLEKRLKELRRRHPMRFGKISALRGPVMPEIRVRPGPYVSKTFLRKQKKRLKELRAAFIKTDYDGAGIAAHQSEVPTQSAGFNLQYALLMVDREQYPIKTIDDALQRIEDGNYGLCEFTLKRISIERLEQLPFTRCLNDEVYEHSGSAYSKKGRLGYAHYFGQEKPTDNQTAKATPKPPRKAKNPPKDPPASK